MKLGYLETAKKLYESISEYPNEADGDRVRNDAIAAALIAIAERMDERNNIILDAAERLGDISDSLNGEPIDDHPADEADRVDVGGWDEYPLCGGSEW